MKELLCLLAAWYLVSFAATAQVLQLLNFQGRVAVNATNFDCASQFKFAFMMSIGSIVLLNQLGLPTHLER